MPHMFQGQMFLTTVSFDALKHVGAIASRDQAFAILTRLSEERPSEVKVLKSFRWQVESSAASDAIYQALIADSLARVPAAWKAELKAWGSVAFFKHQSKLAKEVLEKLPTSLRSSGVFENFLSIFAEFSSFAESHSESYLYMFPGFLEDEEENEFQEYIEAEHGALLGFFDSATNWDGKTPPAPDLTVLESEDPLILTFVFDFVEAHLKHRHISSADFANQLSAFKKESLDLNSPSARQELASYQEWFHESHQFSDFFAEPMDFIRVILHKLSFD